MTVDRVFAPCINKFNHIKTEIPFTNNQITHCSIARLTVKYIPKIDKNVVIPSATGLLSWHKYKIPLVITEPTIPIKSRIILCFVSNLILIISFENP